MRRGRDEAHDIQAAAWTSTTQKSVSFTVALPSLQRDLEAGRFPWPEPNFSLRRFLTVYQDCAWRPSTLRESFRQLHWALRTSGSSEQRLPDIKVTASISSQSFPSPCDCSPSWFFARRHHFKRWSTARGFPSAQDRFYAYKYSLFSY